MQSVATGFLGIGLVVTCLAGYRVLLFAVDLVTGAKHRSTLVLADVVLMVIALCGLALLILGIVLQRGSASTA
jgi:hypothetical protein